MWREGHTWPRETHTHRGAIIPECLCCSLHGSTKMRPNQLLRQRMHAQEDMHVQMFMLAPYPVFRIFLEVKVSSSFQASLPVYTHPYLEVVEPGSTHIPTWKWWGPAHAAPAPHGPPRVILPGSCNTEHVLVGSCSPNGQTNVT